MASRSARAFGRAAAMATFAVAFTSLTACHRKGDAATLPATSLATMIDQADQTMLGKFAADLGVARAESGPSIAVSSIGKGDVAGVTKAGVCTFGVDQTCNDDPKISALHGACRHDGSCSCTGKKAASGKCL